MPAELVEVPPKPVLLVAVVPVSVFAKAIVPGPFVLAVVTPAPVPVVPEARLLPEPKLNMLVTLLSAVLVVATGLLP